MSTLGLKAILATAGLGLFGKICCDTINQNIDPPAGIPETQMKFAAESGICEVKVSSLPEAYQRGLRDGGLVEFRKGKDRRNLCYQGFRSGKVIFNETVAENMPNGDAKYHEKQVDYDSLVEEGYQIYSFLNPSR